MKTNFLSSNKKCIEGLSLLKKELFRSTAVKGTFEAQLEIH